MNSHAKEKQHNMQSPEDRDSIIYQKGFSAGTEHTRSSPETLTKIAQMSEDITNLKVSTGKIETKIDSLTELLKAHMIEEGLNKKEHEEILKTKADKYLVDDLRDNQKWIVRLIVGIVATAVIGLVIKSNL
jgi:hypothetical protein